VRHTDESVQHAWIKIDRVGEGISFGEELDGA